MERIFQRLADIVQLGRLAVGALHQEIQDHRFGVSSRHRA